MPTRWGAKEKFCDGLSRRGFLRIGAFGAGLTLADMLQGQAEAAMQTGKVTFFDRNIHCRVMP